MIVRNSELVVLGLISIVERGEFGTTYKMHRQTGSSSGVQGNQQERSRCSMYRCSREVSFPSHEL